MGCTNIDMGQIRSSIRVSRNVGNRCTTGARYSVAKSNTVDSIETATLTNTQRENTTIPEPLIMTKQTVSPQYAEVMRSLE